MAFLVYTSCMPIKSSHAPEPNNYMYATAAYDICNALGAGLQEDSNGISHRPCPVAHMYVDDLYRVLLCIILIHHYTPSSSPFDCSEVVYSKDTIYTT